MEKITIDEVKEIFNEIKTIMDENRDYLVTLDGAMGDGDLGLTMANGFGAIVNALEKTDSVDIGTTVSKMGLVLNEAAPSTMGTLLATALMRAGKAVKGTVEIGLEEMVEMGKAAVGGIKDRGKADVGDKTIIDSLHPAVEALERAKEEGLDMGMAFKNALAAAQDGMERTKEIQAKFGRAAYYGEKSIGKQDPGATAGMLLVKAICNYFNK